MLPVITCDWIFMESNVNRVGPNKNCFTENFKCPVTENIIYCEFWLKLNFAFTASPIIVNIFPSVEKQSKKIARGMKLKLERQELCSVVGCILLCKLKDLLLCLYPSFFTDELHILQYTGCCFSPFYRWAVLDKFRILCSEFLYII